MYFELDSICSTGGNKFWGVRIFKEKGGKRLGVYNIRLRDMQDISVVVRQSDKTKLLKWLNSEVGQEWVAPRIPKATYSFVGHFLPADV